MDKLGYCAKVNNPSLVIGPEYVAINFFWHYLPTMLNKIIVELLYSKMGYIR